MKDRRYQYFARGVAVVEFALLLSPMILIAFGTAEFGRAIFTYNTLDKAVRDAARHLSQHGPADTDVQAEAACIALKGNADCTGTVLAPGLVASNIVVCTADPALSGACPNYSPNVTGVGSINLVSVSIQGYTFNHWVEYVMPADLTFNSIRSTMRGQL